jgi:hypothetical protein
MCLASSFAVALFQAYIAFFITSVNEMEVGGRAVSAKVVMMGGDYAAVRK